MERSTRDESVDGSDGPLAQGKRLIRSLCLRNFLSYGPDSDHIELGPLNVLIGPNASGKSNLIEALGVLRATPRDLTAPIREGGGIAEWLWKGSRHPGVAQMEAILEPLRGPEALRYRLEFGMVGPLFLVTDEVLECERPMHGKDDVYFFYRHQSGRPVVNVRRMLEEPEGEHPGIVERSLRREDIDLEQSVLSQLRDLHQYPEITYVGRQFGQIRLYREWNLGRRTEARRPQATDLPEDFLQEDAANLGVVLNDLQHRPATWQTVLDYLKKYYELAEAVTTKIHGGTVQLYLHEKGLSAPVPATRLSDGTLRWLCLLSILCHPEPPPLVCIEEPELGLHPDIIPTIAELLVDASQRMQLIVTTHSDILVSALTDVPEAVLVCERDEDGTRVRRLDREQLKEWLEKYTLGELWTMGEIGGTRW